MSRFRLLVRTLWYFRWANLAVTLGIAVGTAVFTGSLIVGDSVQQSLAGIVERRLGDVDHVMVTTHFFPDSLPARLQALPSFGKDFRGAEALIHTAGNCTEPESGAVATGVSVFGRAGIGPGTCVVGETLARHLGVGLGGALVLRMNRRCRVPGDAPLGAEKQEIALVRLKVARLAETGCMEGSFSFYGSQRPVRNIWVPLAELQKALNVPGGANVVFVSAGEGRKEKKGARRLSHKLQGLLRDVLRLEDYGLHLVEAKGGELVLESEQILISRAVEQAAENAEARPVKVFAYLADTVADLRTGREFPYSTIVGIGALPDGPIKEDEIVLNRWAADDLRAAPGDRIEVSYLVRAESGLLEERTGRFTLGRVIETAGIGAEKSLVPELKGMTDAESLAAWDPPRDFPFRPKRIRPKDEDYWRRFGPAPKAFIDIKSAQRMWKTRFGALTSVRFSGVSRSSLERALLRELSPSSVGLVWRPIRFEQLRSASGNTDFGLLFAGFSFFLIASSVLLVTLLMRLSIGQRSRQIALMFATGFTGGRVRNLFLAEGTALLVLGAACGLGGSVGYAWLVTAGLGTVWNEALGMTLLVLHVDGRTLAAGFAAGIVFGALAVWQGVGRLHRMRIAEAISGRRIAESAPAAGRAKTVILAALLFSAAVALVGLTLATDALNIAVSFFAAGACLLGASLLAVRAWLARAPRSPGAGPPRMGRTAFGIRSAARNPTRSMLTMGLLASASFVTVAVSSMKGETSADTRDRKGGSGGYTLIAEFDIPIPYDLGTEKGRRYLALKAEDEDLWKRVELVNMRASAGEDVSCRNLYSPTTPRTLSVPDGFISEGSFSFVASVAKTENPWELLDEKLPAGRIPVIADYDTAQWILHMKLGESLSITDERGAARELRIVALLKKSIFQGELLVSERNFRALFPALSGFKQVLMRTRPEDAARAREVLARDLADFGPALQSTQERLASFSQIANSYISAFEALGGLGMVLGSLGLLVVLVRGAVERRGEIALMSALGFRRTGLAAMMLAENLFLLLSGILIGTCSALFAVAPELAKTYGGAGAPALTFGLLAGMIVLVTAIATCVSLSLVRKVSPAALRLE